MATDFGSSTEMDKNLEFIMTVHSVNHKVEEMLGVLNQVVAKAGTKVEVEIRVQVLAALSALLGTQTLALKHLLEENGELRDSLDKTAAKILDLTGEEFKL